MEIYPNKWGPVHTFFSVRQDPAGVFPGDRRIEGLQAAQDDLIPVV